MVRPERVTIRVASSEVLSDRVGITGFTLGFVGIGTARDGLKGDRLGKLFKLTWGSNLTLVVGVEALRIGVFSKTVPGLDPDEITCGV